MRWTLGTAAVSEMLRVTLFAIFHTPVYFYLIQRFIDRRAREEVEDEELPGTSG
jgi:hypothetical protein